MRDKVDSIHDFMCRARITVARDCFEDLVDFEEGETTEVLWKIGKLSGGREIDGMGSGVGGRGGKDTSSCCHRTRRPPSTTNLLTDVPKDILEKDILK